MNVDTLSENFLVVRDDVYPVLGGGNKGRKMDVIGQFIIKHKFNAIISTGGIQSNHCRAVAIFATKHKLDCTLVLHGDKESFYSQSGNAKIIRDSGVSLVFCEPTDIGEEMNKAMINYKEKNLTPYYLQGGGHTLEGGKAYIDAISEFINKESFIPDFIFLASGTGSTHAGIMAGLDKYQLKSKVIGISVARNRQRAEQVVATLYKELCVHYNIVSQNRDTIVLDDYLCGGYQEYNDDIFKISNESIANYGFALDTTYTAKAFYGMKEYIKTNKIKGNILFWHTGGILNYMAQ